MKKQKTVLLVIDIINSTCHPKAETPEWKIRFKKIRKMIPKLSKFIDRYRESGGKIIFVNCTKWDKKHLTKNLVELYKDPECEYYSEDKTNFEEQFYKIKPRDKEIVVTKNSYSAFTNPELDKILKKDKIKTIVIAGVFSDGCVHSTIDHGFSLGYNFIILKDLVETTDLKIRQDLQKLLKEYTWPKMFGKTISSKDFWKI